MATPKTRRGPSIPFAPDADLTRLSKVKVLPEEVRARMRLASNVSVAESLNIAGPANAAATLTPRTQIDGTKFEIPLAKFQPYDRNPRKSNNAAYGEIKESLRATGPDSLDLWVTQRPGEDWYMPYRGGNTRLAAILELFQEGDTRWERLIVVYKAWISEVDTLTQHLIENNNRADMTFWDKACAYLVDMRSEIEREVGGPVSLRRLEDEFGRRGIGIKKSLISLFQFAVSHLARIGPYLSATQVIQMQPPINLMARLCGKFGIDDTVFQGELDAVLEAQRALLEEGAGANEVGADGVRAIVFIPAVEAALASRLGVTPMEMRRWLDTLGRFPDAGVEDLRSSSPPPASPKAEKHTHAPSLALSGLPGASGEGAETRAQDEHAQGVATGAPDASNTTSTAANGNHTGQDPGAGLPAPERSPIGGACFASPSSPSICMPSTPLEAARAVAHATYIEDCLREYPAMPAGYYIEIPETPIDIGVECPYPSHRVIAWQLLAALSGQWDEITCRSLPTDSMWRRMRLCEGGLDANALPMLMQDQLLVDSCGHNIAGAEDLGWGPSINVGWVVRLFTDPDCASALSGLLLQFTLKRVSQ